MTEKQSTIQQPEVAGPLGVSSGSPGDAVVVVDGEKLEHSTSRSAGSLSASDSERKGSDANANRLVKGSDQPRKPWYRRLNPLRLQKIPPTPKERTPSREYGANIFSVITFQWMAPLMNVSRLSRLV